VETVSWDDIQLFIVEMNKRDEGIYRLPTEAEWEYAARAGSTTAFANGDIINLNSDPVDPNLDAMGWYSGNSAVTYNYAGRGTHPVAQKQPNAWGLFDMHGSVWEWCQDWFGAYPAAPDVGSTRVDRGCCWDDNALYCRSAQRNGSDPSNRNSSIGFRLVVSPGQ